MSGLQQAILSALAYHDAFEVPLTAQEIFLALPAFTGSRPVLADLETALEALLGLHAIATSEGFYFLPGCERSVETRKDRYLLAEGKYKKIRRFLALARHAPYVRAAFVCNTLARSNARAESDIDVYVVAAPGRVWSARAFVTGLAALLGIRPTAADSTDRACLSFFVAADALDLGALAIEDDVYLAHWLHELYPVYDEGDFARHVCIANDWVREVLPETRPHVPSSRRALPLPAVRVKRAVEHALDACFGGLFEQGTKRVQLALMPETLRAAAAGPASDVVLTDSVLKFHDKDRRAEIRDAYRKKVRKILNSHSSSVPQGGAHPDQDFQTLPAPKVQEYAPSLA